jgi:peptidoglycan/xylan/chitin deacetylase (PgdA/CDA1 family)
MMTSGQAAALARAGFTLGGHTVTHPILAQIDRSVARDEIILGRARVEEIAGSRVRLFAYPNGKPQRDYAQASSTLVRELGFDGAVSTSKGAARTGSDPYQIPRFTPWDTRPGRFATQLASNLVRVRPTYVTA